MPKPTETWTVKAILDWTAGFFGEKGVESPRLSAELLLGHVLELERLALYLRFDQPLNPEERAAFRELVKRRAAGEPVAYLTGQKGFWSLDLSVRPGVLIPRPDTETLVEAVLAEIPEDSEGRLLDLGTGSGCILLSLLSEREKWTGVGCDRSDVALETATVNAATCGLSGRAIFRKSDWCAALASDDLFDVIVSNPPYIVSSVIPTLEEQVKDFEPMAALDGGADGLDAYRAILEQAPEHLAPGGWLAFEIGYDQKDALLALGDASGRFSESRAVKDLSGHDRVVMFRARD